MSIASLSLHPHGVPWRGVLFPEKISLGRGKIILHCFPANERIFEPFKRMGRAGMLW